MNKKLEKLKEAVRDFKRESYTKQEVQDLINEIIHRDSLGDIFYHARKIMDRHNMKMIDPRKCEDEYDDEDEDEDYWMKIHHLNRNFD
jgi:hypothetical protein